MGTGHATPAASNTWAPTHSARAFITDPNLMSAGNLHRTEIEDAPAEAEEQAKTISGHSGRVGFATVAAEVGADLGQIAATTRHTDMRIVQRYTRAAEQRRRSAHKLPGVG